MESEREYSAQRKGKKINFAKEVFGSDLETSSSSGEEEYLHPPSSPPGLGGNTLHSPSPPTTIEKDAFRPPSPLQTAPVDLGPCPVPSLVQLLNKRLERGVSEARGNGCSAQGSSILRSQPAPNILRRTARELRLHSGTAVDVNLRPKREKTKNKKRKGGRRNRGRIRSALFYCELCNIYSNSASDRTAHINGSTHRRKLDNASAS